MVRPALLACGLMIAQACAAPDDPPLAPKTVTEVGDGGSGAAATSAYSTATGSSSGAATDSAGTSTSSTTYTTTSASTSDGTGADTGGACDPYAPQGTDCAITEVCGFDGTCRVPGTDREGASCRVIDPNLGTDSCAAGLTCAFADRTGRCMPFCLPEMPSCPTPGQACVADPAASANGPRGLCFTPCEMLIQNCPGQGDGCYNLLTPTGMTTAGCMPEGSGAVGDGCGAPNDCVSGEVCTPKELHTDGCPPSFDFCCTPLCDTLGGGLCLGIDSVCQGLNSVDEPSAGYCRSMP